MNSLPKKQTSIISKEQYFISADEMDIGFSCSLQSHFRINFHHFKFKL